MPLPLPHAEAASATTQAANLPFIRGAAMNLALEKQPVVRNPRCGARLLGANGNRSERRAEAMNYEGGSFHERTEFFMTLDDNEQHHARAILDEIFGQEGFLATISWVKRYTRSNNAKRFYSMKDHLVVYRRSQAVEYVKEPRTVTADEGYTNPDDDPRGPWITSSYVNPATKERRPSLVYPITRPSDGAQIEHPTHAWKYKSAEHLRHVAEQRLHWGQDGDADYPRLKLYLSETNKMVPVDVWNWSELGSSDDGGKAVKDASFERQNAG